MRWCAAASTGVRWNRPEMLMKRLVSRASRSTSSRANPAHPAPSHSNNAERSASENRSMTARKKARLTEFVKDVGFPCVSMQFFDSMCST